MGVEEDLGDAQTMRTAHMDTQTINGLISAAQTAVGGLNQVTSSGTEVTEARTAVAAVMAAIAASTALTEAEKAALSGMISADNTSLTSIEMYRSTAAGQLAVANSAIERARALVAGLSSTSTSEEAAAAYGALAQAQAELHTATNLPKNVLDRLQAELQRVQDTLSDTQSVTSAVVAATTAVAGLDNDSEPADVTAARVAVTTAQTALDGAANALSDGDKASLQEAIDSLDTSLSTVEMAVAERPTAAEIAAAGQKTMDAATKVTAINAEAAETGMNDADLGGTGVETVTMAITRPRSGTEIGITDSRNPDMDEDPQFAEAMDLGESNGFARTMHVRVNSDEDGVKVEEVVIVATDIDPPTATPFGEIHTLDVNTNMENDPEAGDETNEALRLVPGTNNVNLPLIKSASFTAGTAAELTFTNDDDATDADEAFEGDGTYDGADGTYRCNGTAACMVTLDAMGAITGIDGVWIFTPDTGETVDVADDEHLSYGFWLQRTATTEGDKTATKYDEVETFTMASVGIPRPALSVLMMSKVVRLITVAPRACT